jgi:RNA recognition motif-containing protein
MNRSLNLQLPVQEMRISLPVESQTDIDLSHTLFVGDISIFCDEKNLHHLFSSFGEVASVQLKKPETQSTKAHLSYGFIQFVSRESAEIALKKADGFVFLGRALRIGWACDCPSKKSPKFDNHSRQPTAQLHVTFTSRHPTILVTETSLRNIFNHFGDVVDVTVKKTVSDVKT